MRQDFCICGKPVGTLDCTGPLPDTIEVGTWYTFNYPKQFRTLPGYEDYRGKQVQVLRQCTADEADQGCGMERMFHIQAEDGWKGVAWANELVEGKFK